MVDVNLQNEMISFLISTGSFIPTILKEIWKLRKNKKEVELPVTDSNDQKLNKFAKEIINEQNEYVYQNNIKILNMKREIISGEELGLALDLKDHQLGNISSVTLELKRQQRERVIRQQADDIEKKLNELGIYVERNQL